MPHRRPKRSFVLPLVTTLAVAAPLAALATPDRAEYRNADNSELAAIPAQLAEVGLAQVPDVVLPLRELTGLNLPDLHLSDLRQLPLPSSVPIPKGLPLPPGVQLPATIPLPQLNPPQAGTPGQPAQKPPEGSLAPQHQPGIQPPAAPQLLPGVQIPGAPQTQPGAQASGTPPAGPGAQNPAAPAPGAQPPAAPPGQSTAPKPAAPQAQSGAPAPLAPQARPGGAAPTQPGGQTPGVPPAHPGAPQTQPSPQAPGAPQSQTPAGPQGAYTPQLADAPQAPAGAQLPAPPHAPVAVPIAGSMEPSASVPATSSASAADAPIAESTTAPGAASLTAAPAPVVPLAGEVPVNTPDVNPSVPPVPAAPDGRASAAPVADPVDAPGAGPAAPAPAASTPPAPAAAPAPAVIPGADPNTPALAPGAIAPDVAGKVGAEVKELTRDKPFSMVALTAKVMDGMTALIRSRQADGAWGPWYPAAPADTGRNDHISSERTGTEPIYVGLTKAVQVLVTHKASEAVPPGVTPARSDDPALIGSPDLSAVLIDPGRSAVDANLSTVAAPLSGGGPKVITRAQWGADPSLLCDKPTYDDGLGGITVHHTAGRNDYSPAESAGIVRAIYAYHAKTLHWCDIGYNALVDKYGQIFEGRAGGLDKPVEGAHAGGFNQNTSGVALMGDYQSQAPSDAAIQAIGQFIGWRARVAGLNPQGTTTMYSEGTRYTKYRQGEAVKLPTVFAHRDVGNTTCPGDAAYAMMDRIRSIAAQTAGATGAGPGTDAKATVPDNNSGTAPKSQRTRDDIAALADLTTELLGMVDRNAVAKYWDDQGGPNSRLGAVTAEPKPTPDGGQVARFVNGYVYAAPDGAITELAGRLLDRFLALGGESGLLGLPLNNPYPVPDGMRGDFQNGSLIVNTVTGIVTTLYKMYTDRQSPGTSQLPAKGP